ncbi:aminobenzoyl-glutamate utilization protein B [Escherichia coli]|nr:aminobenzoyl-glutamate utilization protein B [Escherichia coli]
MQEIYRFIDDAIEADRQRYTDIADQIWDHPETRFEEFLVSGASGFGAGICRLHRYPQRRQYPKCLYCFVWSRQTGYRPAGRI